MAGEYGFVGVASRLVTYDPQYDNIFRNLLGRTVVVEDLDSGIAMARKFRNGFRIVTLDGQVINRGGSMTGGSVSRSAGVLSRANELERLTARQDGMARPALHRRPAGGGPAARSAEAEYELQVARDQQHKAESEVLTLQTRQDHYDILLDSLRLSCESMEQELAGFDRRDSEDEARIREVQAAIEQAESNAETLRRQVQEKLAGQTDLNDAGDRLAETVSEKKAAQAALLAEKETALRGAEELRRVQEDMAADRAGRDQLAERFRADNEKAAAEIAQRQTRLDELQQQMSALRQQLGAAGPGQAGTGGPPRAVQPRGPSAQRGAAGRYSGGEPPPAEAGEQRHGGKTAAGQAVGELRAEPQRRAGAAGGAGERQQGHPAASRS